MFHPALLSSSVAICATGPSASREQMARAYAKGYDLWLVNDAYRIEPTPGMASLLYACDRHWWMEHHARAPALILRMTQDRGWRPGEVATLGLVQWTSVDLPGLSWTPPVIHGGMSSSFQLLNIAAQCGAKDIVLLGHDLQRVEGRAHFFGEHPDKLRRDSPYSGMIRAYESAAPELAKRGIKVTNASPCSALQCFPLVDV